MPADAEILPERSVAAASQLTLTGYTSNYVTSINMDASHAGRVFCKLLPSSGPAIHTKLHDSSTSVASTALLLMITMINNKMIIMTIVVNSPGFRSEGLMTAGNSG